jgi:hypothetical protein
VEVADEEEEGAAPKSPERYVDETELDLEDDGTQNDNYEEAFLRQFWLSVNNTYAEFAHAQVISAAITKPLAKEKILDLTAGPAADYGRQQLKWDGVPAVFAEPKLIRLLRSPRSLGSPKSPEPSGIRNWRSNRTIFQERLSTCPSQITLWHVLYHA